MNCKWDYLQQECSKKNFPLRGTDQARTTGQSVCSHPAPPQLTPVHFFIFRRNVRGAREQEGLRGRRGPPRRPGARSLVPSLSRRRPHLRARPALARSLAVHAQPAGGRRVRQGVPQVPEPPAPPARARAHRHLRALLRQVLEEGRALSQPLDQVRGDVPCPGAAIRYRLVGERRALASGRLAPDHEQFDKIEASWCGSKGKINQFLGLPCARGAKAELISAVS
jgi:hypothetical protein